MNNYNCLNIIKKEIGDGKYSSKIKPLPKLNKHDYIDKRKSYNWNQKAKKEYMVKYNEKNKEISLNQHMLTKKMLDSIATLLFVNNDIIKSKQEAFSIINYILKNEMNKKERKLFYKKDKYKLIELLDNKMKYMNKVYNYEYIKEKQKAHSFVEIKNNMIKLIDSDKYEPNTIILKRLNKNTIINKEKSILWNQEEVNKYNQGIREMEREFKKEAFQNVEIFKKDFANMILESYNLTIDIIYKIMDYVIDEKFDYNIQNDLISKKSKKHFLDIIEEDISFFNDISN